ncbi:MAG: hypothetical protein ACUVTL_02245 [Thermoproteota archaeon]
MVEKVTWKSIGLSGGGAMYTPSISPHDPKLILLNCDMSAAYRTTDGGETWQMLHHEQLLSSTECRPVFHPIDPNVVFAVSRWRGPLMISRDRGETWSRFSTKLPSGVVEFAIDPINVDLMLAGFRDGGYFSWNAGDTWKRCEGLRGRVSGFHIDQTSRPSERRCFAGTDHGIFESKDGGATWTEIGNLRSKNVQAFVGGSNSEDKICKLYCSIESKIVNGKYEGGIYRSDDLGKTWNGAMGREMMKIYEQTALQYKYLLTTNIKPLTVYASTDFGARVYRSDDGGNSWRQIMFRTKSSGNLNVEPDYIIAETGGWDENVSGANINPLNPDHVILTTWMTCNITKDGGMNWSSSHTKRKPGQGPPGSGQCWINNGLVVTTAWHYYIDPFQHNRHYIAYTDIGFARSIDGGNSWYWKHGYPLRNTTYELAFDPEVPGRIWAAFSDLHDIPNMNVISGRHYWSNAGGGVGISEDFGANWIDSSKGLPGKPVTSIVLDPKSPKDARVLYASCFESGVYKSVDGGKTWSLSSNGLGTPENMRTCRLILHPNGELFVLITSPTKGTCTGIAGAGLYRSKDGGETWEWINRSKPLHWPKDFDVDPRDSCIIYIGAGDLYGPEGGLYKTSDGGETWERIARKGPETFGTTINPYRPNWIYLCLTEGAPGPGLWLSKDQGDTWEPMRGLPFRNAMRVSFDPEEDSIIYVCTFGGSVWKGPAEEL